MKQILYSFPSLTNMLFYFVTLVLLVTISYFIFKTLSHFGWNGRVRHIKTIHLAGEKIEIMSRDHNMRLSMVDEYCRPYGRMVGHILELERLRLNRLEKLPKHSRILAWGESKTIWALDVRSHEDECRIYQIRSEDVHDEDLVVIVGCAKAPAKLATV